MANGFYGCGMFGGGMYFSWIVSFLFAVALVLLIIWLIKKITDDKNNKGGKRN